MVFIQLFQYIASLFLHSIGDLRQPVCGMGQRGGDRVAVVIPWYVSGLGLAADTSACAYVSAWSYSIVDASLRIIFVSRHHFSDQRQHRCYHSNHRQVAGKAHRRRHLYMTFTELEFAGESREADSSGCSNPRSVSNFPLSKTTDRFHTTRGIRRKRAHRFMTFTDFAAFGSIRNPFGTRMANMPAPSHTKGSTCGLKECRRKARNLIKAEARVIAE